MQALLYFLSKVISSNKEPSSEDQEASNHDNQLFKSQKSFDRWQHFSRDACNNNLENNSDPEVEESERISQDNGDSPPTSVSKRVRPNKPHAIPKVYYRVLSRRSRRPHRSFPFLSAIIGYVVDPFKGLLCSTTRCFRGRVRHPIRKSQIKWSFLQCVVLFLLACFVPWWGSSPFNKTRALWKQSGARQKSSDQLKRDDNADTSDPDFQMRWRLEYLTLLASVIVTVVFLWFLVARTPSLVNCHTTPLPSQESPQEVKPGPQDVDPDTHAHLSTTPSLLHASPSRHSTSPSPDSDNPRPTDADGFQTHLDFRGPVQCDDTVSNVLIAEAKSFPLSDERWREAGGGLVEGKQLLVLIKGKLDSTGSTEEGADYVPRDRLVLPRDKTTPVGDLSGWPDACLRPDEPEQPDSSVPAIAELDPPEGNEDAEENEDADVNSWVIPQQEVSNLPFPTEVSSKGRHVHCELVVEKAAISLPPLESMVLSKPSHPLLTLLPLQEIAAVHQDDPAGAQQGHQPRNQASQDQPADLEAEKKVKECFPCVMDHSVVQAFRSLAPE